MKTAIVSSHSSITIKKTDVPKVGPGDILVEMQTCGICGSDVEKVFGNYGQPSMRLGHEPAGIVVSVGQKVKDFTIGDRVFTHHHVPCYSCHYCKHGNETMCPKYYETNLFPCGLSTKYLVPEWNVIHGGVLKLPPHVTFEEAALIEPLACCVRSWKKISYRKGDSVAIFGVGSTGMMHLMLAQEYGFEKCFCIDVNDFRLNFAKKFHANDTFFSNDSQMHEQIFQKTSNRGVDVAIVATGNMTALIDAIKVVRKGGVILLFGVPSKGATINMDVNQIYSKEITLVTSYAASDYDTKSALELITSSKVPVKDLITHKYSLDNSQKAFEHARTGHDAMKIIITK